MDWLKDFEARFAGDDDLRKLGAKKLHGSIQINFCNGHPVNYNLTIHKRSVYNAAVSSVNINMTGTSTLTQGEENDGTSSLRK